MACLVSLILLQEKPCPWVPLAHTVPMADAQGWEPFFLDGLPLLDCLLLMAQCARGSGLWKLEATTFAVGGQVQTPGLISIAKLSIFYHDLPPRLPNSGDAVLNFCALIKKSAALAPQCWGLRFKTLRRWLSSIGVSWLIRLYISTYISFI